MLAGLRGSGVRLAVISNGYRTEQTGKLDTLGLIDMFEVIVVSKAIAPGKPQAAPRALSASSLHAA